MIDSHCHLQAPELAPYLADIWKMLPELGINRLVCNGMSEKDWPDVAELAKKHAEVIPSFGLHPWFVEDRSPLWLVNLVSFLDAHPGCGVGEIGLDKWVQHVDWDSQLEVFRKQLDIAAERNLPATLHCVQAWGPLWDDLRNRSVPKRGFLIHAYGGPVEMVPGFVKRGAYFSFSPWFLHARKQAKRDVFAQIPLDRLLIETDAPSLWPPREKNRFPLFNETTGEALNHPANLVAAFQGLAEIRNMDMDEVAGQLNRNFEQWFCHKV